MATSIFANVDGFYQGFTPDGPVDPPATGWVWESSAIEGGGFQNTVSPSPFLDGAVRPWLIGADVSGPFRSEDGGQLWEPCSGGPGNVSNSARVSSFMWSDAVAGKAFLAEDNGVWRSTNFGRSWSKRSVAADFDGNGTTSPEHPRQTGNLFAQDNSTATKYVWTGTFHQGLICSTDDFSSKRSAVLVGYPIRSIALDPNNPDRIWVAVNRGTAVQNGLWEVTNARSLTPTATKLTSYPGVVSSPVGPEELLCTNEAGTTRLYVAGHESGMFRYQPGSSTWATINTGLDFGSAPKAVFQSIAVDPTNPQVLYCGCWHPKNRKALYKTSNRGTNWAPITGPSPTTYPTLSPFVIDWRMYGTEILSFLRDIPYHSFAGPNSDWIPSQIVVDPDNSNKVMVAGRGGAWCGIYDPANSRWTWRPAVHGLLVTVMMTVTPDELTTGRAVLGNMDYQAIYTPDGGLSAVQAMVNGRGSTGDAAAADMAATTGPSRLFVATSARGQNTGTGGIMSSGNADLGPGSTWTDEVGSAFNSDVVGLAVGRNSSGTRVILAAVSNPSGTTVGGLWRKVGSTWSQFRDPAAVPAGVSGTGAVHNQTAIRFRRDSPVVYAMDGDGIWRSNDAGATWVKILGGVSAVYGTYNCLELDPTDVTKLYFSSGGNMKRINNASTAGAGGATVTTLWSGSAGNIGIDPDGSQMFLNIRDGRIMRSTAFRTASAQAGAGWVDVANDLARGHSANIRSLAVLKGGVVMTADNGSGALRGEFV